MLLGCRARPVLEAGKLTTACEPIIQTLWNHHRLTAVWTSTACYGVSFTLLYVDNVGISQETHLLASTACYGVSFTTETCVCSRIHLKC
jgi:hypothetical protein